MPARMIDLEAALCRRPCRPSKSRNGSATDRRSPVIPYRASRVSLDPVRPRLRSLNDRPNRVTRPDDDPATSFGLCMFLKVFSRVFGQFWGPIGLGKCFMWIGIENTSKYGPEVDLCQFWGVEHIFQFFQNYKIKFWYFRWRPQRRLRGVIEEKLDNL